MTYNTHDTIYYKSAKKLLGYGRKILSAGKCLKYPIESLSKLVNLQIVKSMDEFYKINITL